MQKYLITLAVALFATTAIAEIQTRTVNVECADLKTARQMLKEYNEYPLLKGNISYEKGDTEMMLFMNPETGSWSMMEYIDGLYCIPVSGGNLQMAPEKQYH